MQKEISNKTLPAENDFGHEEVQTTNLTLGSVFQRFNRQRNTLNISIVKALSLEGLFKLR